jgi:nucleoside-diphosphate-sugar epimerase
MRILIAGATGAIGRPSVRRLRANQHEVFALTRSPDSAPALKEIGAETTARICPPELWRDCHAIQDCRNRRNKCFLS